VLATNRTVESGVYRTILDNFDPTVALYPQVCTDLIPRIEAGHIGSPEVRRLSEDYLRPLLEKNIDTLILGCTHLPFIKMIIQDIIGPSVTIIDPARRTAVLCMKTLQDNCLARENHKKPGKKEYFVTGKPADFKKSVQLTLGWKVPKVERIET
jgi:glutamate racemase